MKYLIRFICLYLVLGAAYANALGPGVVQVRSGMVLGSVSGGENLNGNVNTIPYIDAEYQLFMNGRMAIVFRSVLAIDFTTTNVNYAYVGSGQRYFLGGAANYYERSEEGLSVAIKPKMNYFVGWDAGISHMVIDQVGELIVGSTALDAGVTAGFNYYLFNNVAINIGATTSYAFGFSSIAVSGIIYKFFAGVTF